MNVLALIPARGGSKGVPGKNKTVICGKPLIQYSIEAALESSLISDIWVSSDDDQILNIARDFKRIKINQRPSALASDSSPIVDTILYLLENAGYIYDAIVLLQPTSPIKNGKQIDEAIGVLVSNPQANSVISVCSLNDIHPSRMYWLDKETLRPILSEMEEKRRQEIPPAYFRNGAIYVTRVTAIMNHRKVMIKPSIAYVMPGSQLLNIDEPRDLLIAETLISAWKKGQLK